MNLYSKLTKLALLGITLAGATMAQDELQSGFSRSVARHHFPVVWVDFSGVSLPRLPSSLEQPPSLDLFLATKRGIKEFPKLQLCHWVDTETGDTFVSPRLVDVPPSDFIPGMMTDCDLWDFYRLNDELDSQLTRAPR